MKAVGEQLWLDSVNEIAVNLQDMISSFSRVFPTHLFNIYPHLKFRQGGLTLICKQGMFRISIDQEHLLRDVQVLKRISGLFFEPRLNFVVPPHYFKQFKDQEHFDAQSYPRVNSILGLKQLVFKLPGSSQPIFFNTFLRF